MNGRYRRSLLPFFISERYDQAQDASLFAERVQILRAIGFDGIELAIRDPRQIDAGRLGSLAEASGMQVAALGTGRAYGLEGLSFAHPDPDVRRKAIERIKHHVDFATRMGFPPVIIGLIRGTAGPDTDQQSAVAHVVRAMRECADYAGERNVRLAMEPINRYETNLINNVDQALELLETLQSTNVGLLLDTFHMNIEERCIQASIYKAGSRIFHFHVADSNRLAPGWGHLNFGEILNSLDRTGYQGYLSGETLHHPDAVQAARQTFDHLRAVEEQRAK